MVFWGVGGVFVGEKEKKKKGIKGKSRIESKQKVKREMGKLGALFHGEIDVQQKNQGRR